MDLTKKFSLLLGKALSDTTTLPLSYKVVDYFERFIIDNILVPKNIILHAKPNVLLVIDPSEVGKEVFTYSRGTTHRYTLIVIPVKVIYKARDPRVKLAELIFEGIKKFFLKNYKKVTPEFLDDLWNKVDLKYLLKIRFPAPKKDVRYMGHEPEKKKVKVGNKVKNVKKKVAKRGFHPDFDFDSLPMDTPLDMVETEKGIKYVKKGDKRARGKGRVIIGWGSYRGKITRIYAPD